MLRGLGNVFLSEGRLIPNASSYPRETRRRMKAAARESIEELVIVWAQDKSSI